MASRCIIDFVRFVWTTGSRLMSLMKGIEPFPEFMFGGDAVVAQH